MVRASRFSRRALDNAGGSGNPNDERSTAKTDIGLSVHVDPVVSTIYLNVTTVPIGPDAVLNGVR
jgi:hypothetical protein